MKSMLIAFIFLLLNTLAHTQEIKEAAEKIIRDEFKSDITITMKKYEIEAKLRNEIEQKVKQKFFGAHIYVFKIFEGNTLKATALLDNVYGKSQPITFLIIFNLDGSIISTNIVKYREAYGGAVSQKSWNEQFKGKNSDSSFKVGEEVSSISGATISVNSVTLGIKKLTLLFNKIKKGI